MSSIEFLDTLLQYYFPRLDVSSLTEYQWIRKVAQLLRIRQMEKAGSVEKVLKEILNASQQ